LAVTVILLFNVTLQVAPLVLVHPVHEVKELPPDVAGAVSVTAVPAL
jgi:hypothetical protein